MILVGVGLPGPIEECFSAGYMSTLTSPLKPGRGPQHRDGLIHDPLAHPEVILNPPLDFLVIGNLVRIQTGAVRKGPDTASIMS